MTLTLMHSIGGSRTAALSHDTALRAAATPRDSSISVCRAPSIPHRWPRPPRVSGRLSLLPCNPFPTSSPHCTRVSADHPCTLFVRVHRNLSSLIIFAYLPLAYLLRLRSFPLTRHHRTMYATTQNLSSINPEPLCFSLRSDPCHTQLAEGNLEQNKKENNASIVTMQYITRSRAILGWSYSFSFLLLRVRTHVQSGVPSTLLFSLTRP